MASAHQNEARDLEMKTWATPDRILETWDRAWAAGINTFVTNNETEHVIETTRRYLAGKGPMQWIGQLAMRNHPSMMASLDEGEGLRAPARPTSTGGYVGRLLQGSRTPRPSSNGSRTPSPSACRSGVAGHSPLVHDWVNTLDLVDFHVVCIFNCGSLHAGTGHRFQLSDLPPAYDCIARIQKPCIAYKIMGAGTRRSAHGLRVLLRPHQATATSATSACTGATRTTWLKRTPAW